MKTTQCPSFRRPARRDPNAAAVGWLLLLVISSVGASTNSSPIAISASDKLVWVVNPGDDSVSVFRTDNHTRLSRIAVGDEPRSIALTPDGQNAFVANAADGTVTVIRIDDPAWGTFSAAVDLTVGVNGNLTTGAEPWSVVCSPNGQRVFVANSSQDTITVINATTRSIIGNVDLRHSIANDPDRTRHFQPRGLAVTTDNTTLYVSRFLSFTKPGGRQGDDLGKEGLVAVLNINTGSTAIADYTVAKTVSLGAQITGFQFPGLSGDTSAFPNQLQSIVIRGNQAYLPNVAASPTGPLRFNLDTQAFLSVIDGVNGSSPADAGPAKFINLHLGARNPEAGKTKLFFANPWAIAFTTQSGVGNAYVVSAASDLLVKLNVDASGLPSFTGGANQTRYVDLNDPVNPATSGANAGKNPQGIAINSTGQIAYVTNYISRNVSVIDLTTDSVIKVVRSVDLPTPGSKEERVLVGGEMFFSSRGNFDPLAGTASLRNRLSSEAWQSCASCHPLGLTDGVVWQFAAGPRKTPPLDATFRRDQQRMLNYSAIFDEVEDFEGNIRNVSGPGALAGGGLDPDHGLLIADDGTLGAPTAVNAFALANVSRPQVTVTLSGSTTKVPALTALREWVRSAIRTPNAPMIEPTPAVTQSLFNGRAHFLFACVQCHGGINWTVSVKDFVSPPAGADLLTERTPPPLTGNPVGIQFIGRFLRDVGSFNLGVAGSGNSLGLNIGAVETTAPTVVSGVLQAAQDALGKDYNGDGKGTGYNVPSLLGAFSYPPYFHNGAAESLASALSNPTHRSAGVGFDPFDPTRLNEIVSFIEHIDGLNDMLFALEITRTGDESVLSIGTIPGLKYTITSTATFAGASWTPQFTFVGTGRPIRQVVPFAMRELYFRARESQ